MTRPLKSKTAADTPKLQQSTSAFAPSTNTASSSIRVVAVYELLKGIGSLLAAAALGLWHSKFSIWLDGADALWQVKFGQILLAQVQSMVTYALKASQSWQLFVVFTLAYAGLRFVEAYGLWTDKTWAYWISVLGYGMFIPLELYYLVISPANWFKLLVFALNVVIVIVVYRNMKGKGLI